MSLFGWCITGYHEECRHQYIDWNNKTQTCTCKCHKQSEDKK